MLPELSCVDMLRWLNVAQQPGVRMMIVSCLWDGSRSHVGGRAHLRLEAVALLLQSCNLVQGWHNVPGWQHGLICWAAHWALGSHLGLNGSCQVMLMSSLQIFRTWQCSAALQVQLLQRLQACLHACRASHKHSDCLAANKGLT